MSGVPKANQRVGDAKAAIGREPVSMGSADGQPGRGHRGRELVRGPLRMLDIGRDLAPPGLGSQPAQEWAGCELGSLRHAPE